MFNLKKSTEEINEVADSEEYVEVSLGEFLYYSKVVRFCCVLLVILGIIGGFVFEYQHTESVNSKLEELATFDGYDFETHTAAISTSEKEANAKLLRKSDWFKKIDSTKKSKLFEKNKAEYYVVFYKDDCSFCNTIENDIYLSLSKVKESGKSIYWCNIENAGDSTKAEKIKKNIQWSDEDVENVPDTVNKDEFTVSGTPTMVKVTKDSNSLSVYIGADEIESEIGLK